MIKKIKFGFELIRTSCNQPSHIRVILKDIFKSDNKIYSNKDHLKSAMEWLCKAQDVTGCSGVSAAYRLNKGWESPFPETTGYIIPTFIDYASLVNDNSYIERAVKMGEWETEIQLPSGAVMGRGCNSNPIVFDTGQVIFGWISLYKETNMNKFLDAAVKAGDWLISIQDDDGKWSKHTFNGIPHTYNTRVAWSLLEIYNVTKDEKYKDAAERNILWALGNAKENGWFTQMGFTVNENKSPLTHTIAYTLRGLLESSSYLGGKTKENILDIVQKASENIMVSCGFRGKRGSHFRPTYLPGTFDKNWESKDNYSCLTGNVQIAIIWLKLYQINNDARLLNAALKTIDKVKTRQFIDSKNPGIRGGIPGSYPVWGSYNPFTYPNWATKFFADAIMLQESIIRKSGKRKMKD